MKKVFFRCNILVLHIYYCFLLEKQIFKIVNGDVHGTSTGRLRDPVAGRPRDQMMGRSGDVRRTSVIYVLKFNSETY